VYCAKDSARTSVDHNTHCAAAVIYAGNPPFAIGANDTVHIDNSSTSRNAHGFALWYAPVMPVSTISRGLDPHAAGADLDALRMGSSADAG
jgi:hypothetical protein